MPKIDSGHDMTRKQHQKSESVGKSCQLMMMLIGVGILSGIIVLWCFPRGTPWYWLIAVAVGSVLVLLFLAYLFIWLVLGKK
jgi:hypothetical protein